MLRPTGSPNQGATAPTSVPMIVGGGLLALIVLIFVISYAVGVL